MGIEEYNSINQDDADLDGDLFTRTRKSSYWPQLGWFSTLQAFAALFVILLGAILGGFIFSYSRAERSPDILRILTDIPTKETQFVKNEDYFRTDILGDQAWDAMMPNGGGYIRVPYPRDYNLPPSRPLHDSEQSEVYQASVIHQLHCLAVLRKIMISYEAGEILNDPHGPFNFRHGYHCLDTLRQAVLCTADVTLAYGVPRNGGKSYHYNGMGTVHKCRDWEVVKEILTQYRGKNYTGSLTGT